MIDSILPFLFAHAILLVGLIYTRPFTPARVLMQGIIYVCCFISVRSTLSLSIPGQAGGQYIYGMMMQSSHWMLLAGASAATHAKQGREWRWAIDMLFSARWGVSPKMLPPFRRKNRSYIPDNNWFVLTRSWDLVWAVALICLIRRYPLYLYQSDFTSVPDGFLRRLSSVTPAEWVIRIYMTLLGKGEPYLALRAGHSLVSIIAVIGGDSPERYPPLFGSIKEAYRVRRFYVHFWHHLIRKAFTSHSSFVINDILHVPRQTPTSRYLVLAFTFLMSAGMHVFVAPNVPLRCSAWPQLRYYFSIAGAIILEDVTIQLYRQMARRQKNMGMSNENATGHEVIGAKASSVEDKSTQSNELKQRSRRENTKTEVVKANEAMAGTEQTSHLTPAIARSLGYIWVASFEVWSTSKFLFLTQQCLAT